MELLLIISAACTLALLIFRVKAARAITKLTAELHQQDENIARQAQEHTDLLAQITTLSKYQSIVDAEEWAKKLIAEAESELAKAKQDAARERQDASQSAKSRIEQSERNLEEARVTANRIIEQANKRAEEIAGDAYTAMSRAKELADTARAMKNIIEGYGDAYIVPTYNLLDDLAEEFAFTDAGQKLKAARDASRGMVKTGRAATCDYAEANRKGTAIRFVIDAFNGKVDSILSRNKADNHGKLEQEIRDAFAMVNHNGTAFRNARITEEYLSSRLEELKWAATTRALKEQEREEQRQLREQMREEEKARREFERAIKDAAKEEETIKKAMDKVLQQVATANDAQRAEYETKLRELEDKLQVAEEKNQRALSMAQQTRAGHVYVISNIGSFGEEVFKIGMTRRLEPKDRIRELGDASVPFEFDVHAMIFSDDAPGLEKTLHRHFLRRQMNKVNPRKEFFRLELAEIRTELESLGVETLWTMAAEAHEYRETIRIEQQIRENPVIEQQWTRHQLEFEAQEEVEAAV
ncbi:DUF4041 domain-containing protein [Pseudomonas sp. P9_31]|uniref:DUF4041 domain-containing protein n=1 Tax=Pseudomonas sp. P9_31 TaxID=3043448 RepID=UPI002A35A87F|nr:DUF4041 domain-containing protein [Pseudomonas sp. P9_31]WPN56002.1 DUF4041 domain-containing protein [Pseudomonas sp. P9_31]